MRAVVCQVEDFHEHVDSWVHEALQSGVGQFDSLLRRLPGVYPVDVARSIRRQSSDGMISRPIAKRLLSGTDCPSPTIESQPSLPAPHPLDFDWRFTHSTSKLLLQESTRVAKTGDSIVCLGAPSVYQEALRQGAARRAALIDANPAVIGHFLDIGRWLRVWRCDLLTETIPALRSSALVVDPPWYPEQMSSFLWAASQICTIGGHVFVSLPPRGTRPGIAAEVGSLMTLAIELGFDIDRIEECSLQYDSPPFEQNALTAVGIRLASYNWRCGDLCVLRLRAAKREKRPLVSGGEGWWDDEFLLGMRLRLRKTSVARFGDPCLVSLVPGDVLPSVSRRYPLRRSVDVWTAGNRVFACAGTEILRLIIQAVARGQTPPLRVASFLGRCLTHRERQLIDVATEQMKDLAKQEGNDLCFANVG